MSRRKGAGPVKSVLAVVVHYGDREPTHLMVKSLADRGVDCVVLSNDGQGPAHALPADANWVVAPRNLGYFGAVKYAMGVDERAAGVDVVAALNTDLVLTQECWNLVLDCFMDPLVGVVGPVLRYEDGSLQSGAATWSPWLKAPRVMVEPGPVVRECDWVTGAAIFMSRTMITDIGLDGSYFLGCEDADICLRARRAGWKVICDGRASAVHHRSKVITGARWNYYAMRNRIWFVRRNYGHLAVALNIAVGAILYLRVLAADVLKRRGLSRSRMHRAGLRDSFRRQPDPSDGPDPREPWAGRVIAW